MRYFEPIPMPSMLRKKGCDIFVPLDHITPSERREAAARALRTFDDKDIDVWCLGSNNTPGFWFKNQKDAVFFILMIK